jgi:hypothetical protein
MVLINPTRPARVITTSHGLASMQHPTCAGAAIAPIARAQAGRSFRSEERRNSLFFLPGEFHKTSAVGDEPPIVLRLEAQLLDRVARHAYDLESHQALSHR